MEWSSLRPLNFTSAPLVVWALNREELGRWGKDLWDTFLEHFMKLDLRMRIREALLELTWSLLTQTHLELAHPIPCHLCTMMFTFHSKMVAHCQVSVLLLSFFWNLDKPSHILQKISDCSSQDVHSLQLPSKEEQLTCPLCRLFFPTMAR